MPVDCLKMHQSIEMSKEFELCCSIFVTPKSIIGFGEIADQNYYLYLCHRCEFCAKSTLRIRRVLKRLLTKIIYDRG